MQKKETTVTKQNVKLPETNQLLKSKTSAEITEVFAIPSERAVTRTEQILITEFGQYKQPKCRTGWLLLRGHAGRTISELGEQWLRRWTIPGLDSTACDCPKCGGVWYTDDQMVARLTNRRRK
jgi:hypothetical protein